MESKLTNKRNAYRSLLRRKDHRKVTIAFYLAASTFAAFASGKALSYVPSDWAQQQMPPWVEWRYYRARAVLYHLANQDKSIGEAKLNVLDESMMKAEADRDPEALLDTINSASITSDPDFYNFTSLAYPDESERFFGLQQARSSTLPTNSLWREIYGQMKLKLPPASPTEGATEAKLNVTATSLLAIRTPPVLTAFSRQIAVYGNLKKISKVRGTAVSAEDQSKNIDDGAATFRTGLLNTIASEVLVDYFSTALAADVNKIYQEKVDWKFCKSGTPDANRFLEFRRQMGCLIQDSTYSKFAESLTFVAKNYPSFSTERAGTSDKDKAWEVLKTITRRAENHAFLYKKDGILKCVEDAERSGISQLLEAEKSKIFKSIDDDLAKGTRSTDGAQTAKTDYERSIESYKKRPFFSSVDGLPQLAQATPPNEAQIQTMSSNLRALHSEEQIFSENFKEAMQRYVPLMADAATFKKQNQDVEAQLEAMKEKAGIETYAIMKKFHDQTVDKKQYLLTDYVLSVTAFVQSSFLKWSILADADKFDIDQIRGSKLGLIAQVALDAAKSTSSTPAQFKKIFVDTLLSSIVPGSAEEGLLNEMAELQLMRILARVEEQEELASDTGTPGTIAVALGYDKAGTLRGLLDAGLFQGIPDHQSFWSKVVPPEVLTVGSNIFFSNWLFALSPRRLEDFLLPTEKTFGRRWAFLSTKRSEFIRTYALRMAYAAYEADQVRQFRDAHEAQRNLAFGIPAQDEVLAREYGAKRLAESCMRNTPRKCGDRSRHENKWHHIPFHSSFVVAAMNCASSFRDKCPTPTGDARGKKVLYEHGLLTNFSSDADFDGWSKSGSELARLKLLLVARDTRDSMEGVHQYQSTRTFADEYVKADQAPMGAIHNDFKTDTEIIRRDYEPAIAGWLGANPKYPELNLDDGKRFIDIARSYHDIYKVDGLKQARDKQVAQLVKMSSTCGYSWDGSGFVLQVKATNSASCGRPSYLKSEASVLDQTGFSTPEGLTAWEKIAFALQKDMTQLAAHNTDLGTEKTAILNGTSALSQGDAAYLKTQLQQLGSVNPLFKIPEGIPTSDGLSFGSGVPAPMFLNGPGLKSIPELGAIYPFPSNFYGHDGRVNFPHPLISLFSPTLAPDLFLRWYKSNMVHTGPALDMKWTDVKDGVNGNGSFVPSIRRNQEWRYSQLSSTGDGINAAYALGFGDVGAAFDTPNQDQVLSLVSNPNAIENGQNNALIYLRRILYRMRATERLSPTAAEKNLPYLPPHLEAMVNRPYKELVAQYPGSWPHCSSYFKSANSGLSRKQWVDTLLTCYKILGHTWNDIINLKSYGDLSIQVREYEYSEDGKSRVDVVVSRTARDIGLKLEHDFIRAIIPDALEMITQAATWQAKEVEMVEDWLLLEIVTSPIDVILPALAEIKLLVMSGRMARVALAINKFPSLLAHMVTGYRSGMRIMGLQEHVTDFLYNDVFKDPSYRGERRVIPTELKYANRHHLPLTFALAPAFTSLVKGMVHFASAFRIMRGIDRTIAGEALWSAGGLLTASITSSAALANAAQQPMEWRKWAGDALMLAPIAFPFQRMWAFRSLLRRNPVLTFPLTYATNTAAMQGVSFGRLALYQAGILGDPPQDAFGNPIKPRSSGVFNIDTESAYALAMDTWITGMVMDHKIALGGIGATKQAAAQWHVNQIKKSFLAEDGTRFSWLPPESRLSIMRELTLGELRDLDATKSKALDVLTNNLSHHVFGTNAEGKKMSEINAELDRLALANGIGDEREMRVGDILDASLMNSNVYGQ